MKKNLAESAKRIALMIAICLLVCSIAVCTGAALADEVAEDNSSALNVMTAQIRDMRDRQLQIDEMLLAELNSGAYTLEEPLIIVDPYGFSPLTAVVLFKTEEPQNISIHIAGDTKLAEVDYTFEGYNTDHMIPVYGLYASRENQVTLTAQDQNGTRQTVDLIVETDQLPDQLSHEKIEATLFNEEKYQPGFTFTYRGNNDRITRSALDVNGDYRWCFNLKGNEPLLAKSVGNGGSYNNGNSIFIAVGSLLYGDTGILEFNLLGKLLNAWYSVYGQHHDIALKDDCLWITGTTDENSKEDMIYCLDRKTGELLKVIDYNNILQKNRNQLKNYPKAYGEYYTDLDWVHINSIDFIGDNVVISSRNQSTVVCNDQEGNIKWMLCDPAGYNKQYKQYMLNPVGKNFFWPYTQHAADVLPDQDGNPDTVDILLFDNGNFRLSDKKKASHMIQYRINEKGMTVQLIWSWGEDRKELYSMVRGDADLLENGNRLGSFEPRKTKKQVCYAHGVEVDEQGEPVWEITRRNEDETKKYCEYRLERLKIYAEAANDLSLGVPANLFLPEE